MRRSPSVETLFVATIALLGLRLGLRPIGDNSTFVHLRTGLDIVDGLGIPRRDPYSFTAAGEPWVVQSWFASVIYGGLERLGGLELVVVLHGLLYGGLAWAVATLARTGRAVKTAAAAIVAVGIGIPYWAPRPLAIGLAAMAVTVLVVERQLAPWVLVPTAWLWVNSHGSFVLGGLWLVLAALAGTPGARRYLPWFAGGVAAAAINPLGPRLLLFPLTVLDKRQNLARVVEWRPPTPRNPFLVFALLCLVLAIAGLLWALKRRLLTARQAVPALVFLALGVVSQRNLAPAAVVVAPILGRVLASPDPLHVLGEKLVVPRPISRPERVDWAFAGVLGLVAAIFLAAAAVADPLDLDDYPSSEALAAAGAASRLVSTDVVGGYRILLDGRRAAVFVDDRYDMYPDRVIADYLRLLDGDDDALAVLDRYRVDAVIWPEREELAAMLGTDPAWRRVLVDDDWVVFLRG